MELRIGQRCPSCGAAIELHEDDRLLLCSFCGGRNFRKEENNCRYVLQATANVSAKRLLYLPYLRFKGTIYTVSRSGVGHRSVDTTRIGLDSSYSHQLPLSLGLRPQTLPVVPVVAKSGGRFVRQNMPLQSILFHAVAMAELLRQRERTIHRSFVGESVSRVYLPCHLREDGLADAITGRNIAPVDIALRLLEMSCHSRPEWEPAFISTHCPGCGGILDGEKGSRVLVCRTCQNHCHCQQGKFVALNWQILGSGGRNHSYLPFWEFDCTLCLPRKRGWEQFEKIASFGSFLRFANQPVGRPQDYDSIPLRCLIPGFTILPASFFKIARRLTMWQTKLPQEGERKMVGFFHPITLGEEVARRFVKTVFAGLTVDRRHVLPLFSQLRVEAGGARLLYLPFRRDVHDWIQEETGTALQGAAIRYGKFL